MLQGARQGEPVRGRQDQVAGGLRLAPLQHAGIEVGGKVQFVGHPALECLQHQQLVVGIDAQYADGTDAAFAIASIGLVFAGDVVGQAPQVVKLRIAVGLFQRAEVDRGAAGCVFAGIGAGGFVGARRLFRQAPIQAA